VFFSDSGSSAVEVALKQSFQYWQLQGLTAKKRFLRLDNAYHGDTLGAVGVGGIELFHRVFGPILVDSLAVPCPDRADLGEAALDKLERILGERSQEIAAIVMEPLIQGAAGMLLHPPGFLRAVSDLCEEYSIHLIVDEVATGFGRTGKMFAIEHEGVVPDFVCLAKGIAGGYLPLAATVTTEEVYSAFLGTRAELKHFFHGHTFTANPLACAVGLASLELLQTVTLANAQARIPELEAHLATVAALSAVLEVRQLGMMAGIELRPLPDRFAGVEVCARAREHGVILRPLGDVVVWMPPLAVSADDLSLLARATTAAIHDVYA
jgi:adenosylmethionine-8-amino-7-oxononanoate aminotransferase